MRARRKIARDRKFVDSTYAYEADDAADRTGSTYHAGDKGKIVLQVDTGVRHLITAVAANGTATFEAIPDIDDLASTASGKGGALIGHYDASSRWTAETVSAILEELMDRITATDATALAQILGIQDSGDKITAENVEAALVEIATNVDTIETKRVQTHSQQVTHADLTEDGNGTLQEINLSTALPTGARIVGVDVLLTTQFTGGSVASVTVDVGTTGAEELIKDFDALGSTAGAYYDRGAGAATRVRGNFSEAQLVIGFTPDGSHALADLTAGDLTVAVDYYVPA